MSEQNQEISTVERKRKKRKQKKQRKLLEVVQKEQQGQTPLLKNVKRKLLVWSFLGNRERILQIKL